MTQTSKTNRVFVLGAGASRALKSTAPLNKELLVKILEKKDAFGLKKLSRFVEEFYNVAIGSENWEANLPLIEDVLSQIDFALSEKRSISNIYTLSALERIRNQLVQGICKLIGEGDETIVKSETNLASTFMNSLTDRDAIISLNYDLIIDNALCHRQVVPQVVDYDISIREAINCKYHTFPYKQNSQVKLYKLHGSLNWLYCPRCQSIDLTMEEDGTINYISRYAKDMLKTCKHCHVRYESLIIAPTFLKTYNNTYLYQLWRRAEMVLSEANEIIFIGYSLPDADIVLRCMFKRAYFSRSQLFDKKLCQIRVVDWVELADRKKKFAKETSLRYARLFKDIDYENTGFVKYIERGCKTKKESKLKTAQLSNRHNMDENK